MDIANILLRITGDSDSARRDLQQTAAEVAAFDRMDAEATADVNTAIARSKIKALKAEIATLADEITMNVDVDTGAARLKMAALTGELKAQEAVLDSLTPAVDGAGGAFGGLAGRLGPVAGGLGPIAGIAGVLVPTIFALSAAIFALVASLSAAVGGLLALGGAFGATLLPALALGIGAFQRFKDQADITGTAANRLKTAGQNLGQTFSKALGPAADKVFDGMAKGASALEPMIAKLRPAFTQFGAAVGKAFSTIGRELSNPAWTRFFTQTIGSASRIVGPLTSSFLSLSRILRNIATAAMPFLESGFKSMAGWLKGLAKDSGTQKFADGIAGIVDHLKSWLELGKQVGRVVLGFFKGAAPAGKGLVDQLARGAEKLADWANSAQGQAAIKQFFADVIPLAQQVVELAGKIFVAILKITQVNAPGFAQIVADINSLFDAINKVLGPLDDLKNKFEAFSGVKLPSGTDLFNPANIGNKLFDGVVNQARGAVGEIRPIGASMMASFRAGIAGAQGQPAAAVRLAAANAARQAAIARGIIAPIGASTMAAFRNAISRFGPALKNTGKNVADGAVAGVKGTGPAFGKAGQGLGAATRQGVVQSKAGVLQAARALASGALPALRGQAGSFRAAGVALSQRVREGINQGRGEIRTAARELARGAIEAVRNGIDGMRSAGEAMGQGLLEGLQSQEGAILSWADGIANQISEKIRAAAKVKSPSRVTYGIGEQIGRGLALGLASQTASVLSAATELSVGALVPAQALAGAGATDNSRTQTNYFDIKPIAGTESPGTLVAQLNQKLIANGGLG